MCESYHLKCDCGRKQAEIFFGKMLLDERSINRLFCPECSGDNDDSNPSVKGIGQPTSI
jgi:hypothetical protein